MKLKELLTGIPVLSATADLEMEVSNISYDSRTVKPGDLFVALTGLRRGRPCLHRQGPRCRRGGSALRAAAGR